MLTFQDLLKEIGKIGITRKQAAIATGFGEDDEAIERFVELNRYFTPQEASRQLSQCLGMVGQPLYGSGS